MRRCSSAPTPTNEGSLRPFDALPGLRDLVVGLEISHRPERDRLFREGPLDGMLARPPAESYVATTTISPRLIEGCSPFKSTVKRLMAVESLRFWPSPYRRGPPYLRPRRDPSCGRACSPTCPPRRHARPPTPRRAHARPDLIVAFLLGPLEERDQLLPTVGPTRLFHGAWGLGVGGGREPCVLREEEVAERVAVRRTLGPRSSAVGKRQPFCQPALWPAGENREPCYRRRPGKGARRWAERSPPRRSGGRRIRRTRRDPAWRW